MSQESNSSVHDLITKIAVFVNCYFCHGYLGSPVDGSTLFIIESLGLLTGFLYPCPLL